MRRVTLAFVLASFVLASSVQATAILRNHAGSPTSPPTTASPTKPPSNRGFEAAWELAFPASFYGLPEFGWRSVFVCADANVLAINRRNGTLVWKAVVESACQYIAALQNLVVVGSDHAVTAFDEVTGAHRWTHNFTGGVAGTPAHTSVVGWDKVAYTVENGQASTPFTVLSQEGAVVFQTTELATSRIWFTDNKAIYVQAPSASDSTLSLVARDAQNWNVSWSRSSFSGDAVNGGGAVAFNYQPAIVMVAPAGGATGVAVVDPATGLEHGKPSLFTGQTNNFDYSTGDQHYFTIMSYGAPNFANSTLSAWKYEDGSLAWQHNVTLASPNLLPLPGVWNSAIAAQGAQAIAVYDQESGELIAEVPFTNPKWVIGNAQEGQMIIGNTVEGKVHAFRYE
jgi:hypothetical protein